MYKSSHRISKTIGSEGSVYYIIYDTTILFKQTIYICIIYIIFLWIGEILWYFVNCYIPTGSTARIFAPGLYDYIRIVELISSNFLYNIHFLAGAKETVLSSLSQIQIVQIKFDDNSEIHSTYSGCVLPSNTCPACEGVQPGVCL